MSSNPLQEAAQHPEAQLRDGPILCPRGSEAGNESGDRLFKAGFSREM